MADQQLVTKQRFSSSNQRFSLEVTQMDCDALGRAILRAQAQYIRSSLEAEINEFESSFSDILQTASVFLAIAQRVTHSPSLEVVDEASVVKAVCHFLASSNIILEFLDFQQQTTGLASGGDSSLEKQVKAAQVLVEQLLSTLLLHKRAESYPGKESGLLYNENVKVFGGFVLHKYAQADHSDIPDPTDDSEDMGRVLRYWHPESLFHPLRHVPGTPWHKFFGNLKPGPIVNPALFRKRKPLPVFKIILPETIEWLAPEVISNYNTYREMFEATRRLPGPCLSEFSREGMTRKVQRRVSNLFEGWKRFEDSMYLHSEDMSEIPCPEFELSGLSRLESLNAEINATELAGISLLGADIPPVPVILNGEGRKYCLEFDGQWNP